MKLFLNKSPSHYPTTLREALHDCEKKQSERGKEYVYKKYYGYVMAIAIRYLQHEMEAEELTNETFIKCFQNLKRFKKHDTDEILEKQFKGWIARIAVNASIDLIRRQKNNQSLDDVAETNLKVYAHTNSQRLDYTDLLSLLNHLPPIQKTIFNLFEIEGYSHYEIGEKLDIPEGTSRTYLTRAKKRLRTLYHYYFNEVVEDKRDTE